MKMNSVSPVWSLKQITSVGAIRAVGRSRPSLEGQIPQIRHGVMGAAGSFWVFLVFILLRMLIKHVVLCFVMQLQEHVVPVLFVSFCTLLLTQWHVDGGSFWVCVCGLLSSCFPLGDWTLLLLISFHTFGRDPKKLRLATASVLFDWRLFCLRPSQLIPEHPLKRPLRISSLSHKVGW